MNKKKQLRKEKVEKRISGLDEQIGKASIEYAFDRIQVVERNILRLGLYEILFDDEVPPKVAISEAIRLARKFGTPEAASFINAILDNIYKLTLGKAKNPEEISDSTEALVEIEEVSAQADQDQTDANNSLGDQLP